MESASLLRQFRVCSPFQVRTTARGQAKCRQVSMCSSASRPDMSRRSTALFLGGCLSILAPTPVRALLPAEDQEDEELVGLAKSRRRERLAEERSVEKKFVNKADYSGADLSSVQNAVNRLAKEGLSLESGNLNAVASSSDSWVGDLKKAIGDLSSSPAAQSSSSAVLSSLDALNQSFRGGDIENAKSRFTTAVSALQAWIADAGLSSQIKGL